MGSEFFDERNELHGMRDVERDLIYAKESGATFSCAYITFLNNESRMVIWSNQNSAPSAAACKVFENSVLAAIYGSDRAMSERKSIIEYTRILFKNSKPKSMLPVSATDS
jgi:hypothetical protein